MLNILWQETLRAYVYTPISIIYIDLSLMSEANIIAYKNIKDLLNQPPDHVLIHYMIVKR